MSGKTQFWLGILCAVFVSLLLWRVDHLSGELKREKTAHEKTVLKLADAEKERDGWRNSYDEAVQDIFAQRENAQDCLDREAAAQASAAERAAIMKQVKPRPRPKQEEVVDDETRSRIAGRLNRPL